MLSPSFNEGGVHYINKKIKYNASLCHRSYLFLVLIFYLAINIYEIHFGRVLLSILMSLSFLGIRSISVKQIIYTSSLILILVFCYLIVGFQIGFLFILFPTITFAYYLVSNLDRRYSWKPEFFLLFFLSLFLIYKLVTVYDINTEILVTSRNQISILMYVCLFFLLLSQPPKKIILLSTLLIFVVCFVSFSRSAMLSSTILLVLTLLIVFRLKFFIVVFFILFSICIFFYNEILALYDAALSAPFVNDPRMIVMSCYMDSIDVYSVIFGLNYSAKDCALSIGQGYSLDNINVHNSYLALLSYSSLFFFLSVPLVFFNVYKSRNFNVFLFVFAIVFFVRAYFDNVIFFSELDFIFWFFLFFNTHRITCNTLSIPHVSRNFDMMHLKR